MTINGYYNCRERWDEYGMNIRTLGVHIPLSSDTRNDAKNHRSQSKSKSGGVKHGQIFRFQPKTEFQ